MAYTTPNTAAPYPFTLDLSEGTVITCLGRSIAVMEPSGVYEALDVPLLTRDSTLEGNAVLHNGFMAVFRAGRLTENGEYIEIERCDLAHGHALYGKKLLEGTAYYPDGNTEGWRIQVDPLNMRWNWTRQPDQPSDRLVLRLITPNTADRFTFWQTGRGQTCQSGKEDEFTAEEESELLCVGPTAKNSFRVESVVAGDLRLSCAADAAECLAGETGWESTDCPVFEAHWVFPSVGLLRFNASWGLAQAAQDFQGRQPFVPVQATMDFDVFYARMALAALPLYLSGGDRLTHYSPRASLASGAGGASLYDITFACEFLPLADPRAAGVLMRDTIDVHTSLMPDPAKDPQRAALLLLLAGRYATISGDLDFLGARLADLRNLADGLLARRPKGEALPLIDTGDGPAKEPVFTALCFAGLKRLAELEHTLAAPDQAKRWLTAAEGMRLAALTPYTEGGLLHPARGVFVNYALPRAPRQSGPIRARTSFRLQQFVIACALGLMDDTASVSRGYDWIDDQYTYATGRGGASSPPGAERGLYALLDVYVRQANNVASTERVLQLVLDHALDFGVPMLGLPYAARLAEGANFADAAPYLGIVLGLHYGLDYTRQGWLLSTPRPLANYPCSRVTGLRHKHASYSVTWQGRGRIKRIVVDGRTHRANLLADSDGEHEVTVYLG